LFHPIVAGTCRATGEVNSARLEFHDEKQIECDQATLGSDFHRGKVDGSQDVPV
jgi:hypothetical protein